MADGGYTTVSVIVTFQVPDERRQALFDRACDHANEADVDVCERDDLAGQIIRIIGIGCELPDVVGQEGYAHGGFWAERMPVVPPTPEERESAVQALLELKERRSK